MDFFYRYKTIFLLLGLFLASILIGFLIYSFFFKNLIAPSGQTGLPSQDGQPASGFPPTSTSTSTALPDQDQAPGEAKLPETKASAVANGGLTSVKELSPAPALGISLDKNGLDLKFYNQADGKFYRIDKDGEMQALSEKVFHNVENVIWANSQEKAVLEYPDGDNIVFDFSTQKQITLPDHWQDFDFSPQDDSLVLKSLARNKENNYLAIANADGSGVRPIEALGDNEKSVYADWSPNNQIVAMYTKGLDFNRQEIFFIGQNDENFKSTVVEGRGFDPKWSPQGDKLLYSVYSSDNGMRPNLWLVDSSGDNIGANRKNLNLNTWADKCVYAENSLLYCAVPENLPEGAGIFPELSANTKDQLYRIDTKTGLKKLVAIPDGTFNMSDLIISENKYYLYFTDKKSQTIHQIKLK